MRGVLGMGRGGIMGNPGKLGKMKIFLKKSCEIFARFKISPYLCNAIEGEPQ